MGLYSLGWLFTFRKAKAGWQAQPKVAIIISSNYHFYHASSVIVSILDSFYSTRSMFTGVPVSFYVSQ